MLTPAEKHILRLQSDICKMLSNPTRLEFVHELRTGEKTVSELCAATGARQANVSQHLALMRHAKIVSERREGNTVYYRIADRRITKACDAMRDVLIHRATEDSKLIELASTGSHS